jgi:hypothetical protein
MRVYGSIRANSLRHVCHWRALRSVLVLKKLGDELLADFVRVLRFLGAEEGMRVVVEPHEYIRMVGRAGLGFIDTYTPAEAVRCGLARRPQLPLSPCHAEDVFWGSW